MISWKSLIPAAALFLAACASTPQQPYDYTAFKESSPKSILVLPPLNESPDINATAGMLASATRPLAESGYYVFPVAVVNETFKQNGLTQPADIHQVKLDKLHQIFGADAVLYITVKQYGTSYQVIQSDTRVSAEATLIDSKTGKTLWTGSASASSIENQNSGQSGLLGMLVSALIDQIASSVTDKGFDIAQVTGSRLLGADMPRGILFGPRSPHYQTQPGK
ncbi:DUF799 domain-containing protein [Neisseria sp. ZJ106]|uniref:DUF799 domain-containing protein n=1 Tax=Neisseria lisongii TaxID=2912188 RepID=A0ABY7RJG2_9NEIS|nr:DUF799 domain-containing protein [Neisseria lisongii]MCF7521969.1 DUF799 domain-containing protein [Neisseria lisongii]WCL71343.1 DUF799 domain-containing protein [Neisseria lisongii]